jgi:hypothetical protein
VVIEDAEVAFATPILFDEVDPERVLNEDIGSAWIVDMASALRMTPAALKSGLLENLGDVLVGSPQPGFRTNIIAARSQLQAIPSDEELVANLTMAIGGEGMEVEHVTTPAGDGIRASYSGDAGSQTFYGRLILVDTTDHIASVTVTSGSAEEVSTLADRVLETVRPIP